MKRWIISLVVALMAGAGALVLDESPLAHNAEDGLSAGHLLQIVYRGDPAKELSFELEGLAHGLIFDEVQPGLYEGRMMITPSMTPYRGRLLVNDSQGRTLACSTARFNAGVEGDVVQFLGAQGRLYLAFDRKIAADTIVVDAEGRELTFPGELQLRNNFFVTRATVTPEVTASALDLLGRRLESDDLVISSRYAPHEPEGVSLH